MASRDIIVVGASAGGVDALTRLVGGLPAGLPASVFVVCHFPAGGRSVLPDLLSGAGRLLAANETVNVSLSNQVNAAIGDRTAVGTIVNDD